MTSLRFEFDGAGRTRIGISQSAAWGVPRDHVSLQFLVEPDLVDEAASSRLRAELRRRGVAGMEFDESGWRVDGDVVSRMLGGHELPGWFKGEFAAAFAARQKMAGVRGSEQRRTEIVLTVQEPDPLTVGLSDAEVGPKELSAMAVTIHSREPFKSIEPIEQPITLPRFSVLTGKNGAGKTHLLSGIAAGTIVLSINGKPVAHQLCRYLGDAQLAPTGLNKRAQAEARPMLAETVKSYEEFRRRRSAGQNVEPTSQLSMPQVAIVERIARAVGKDFDTLVAGDFSVFWPLIDLGATDVFAENLVTVCRRYDGQQQKNRQAKQYATEYGHDVRFMSEEEFDAYYGPPPWEFINEAFEKAGLPLRLKYTVPMPADISYELTFSNERTGIEISPEDLSSGEKVLLSLFAAMYNSGRNDAFPKVLLFDEPDCHLHPEMTRGLLTILESVLVEERGLTVLMTTHSPSTVGLSSEGSLFAMQSSVPKVAAVSKDEAIGVLLEGVPSLSMSHENRRQVFVEARADCDVLGRLFTLFRGRLRPDVSLSFLEVGVHKGKGGADMVKAQVARLREAGVSSALGIIDSDGGRNKDGDSVFVLGGGSRYTLENYLLDPLLIAACFVRKNKPEPVKVGLPKDVNIRELPHLSCEQLQVAADTIVRKVSEVHKDTGNPKPVKVTYADGLVLELPAWYLTTSGKGLLESVCKVFVELSCFHEGNSSGLILAISDQVVGLCPEFVPAELVSMMHRLQCHGLSAKDSGNVEVTIKSQQPPAV